MPAPHPSPARLAAGALLVAALPVGFLLGDLALVLAPPSGDVWFTATSGDVTYSGTYVEITGDGPAWPQVGYGWAQAFATVSVSPALLTSCLGLAVLAALTVAGLAVPRGVRVAGVLTAAVVVALAALTALAVGVGAQHGYGGFFVPDPSAALRDAPVVGPLVAVAVFAALAGLALTGRRGRA